MTPALPPLKARYVALVLAGAVLLLALQWLPDAAQALRFSRPAFAAGQWWLLLSGQTVHLSLAHAALNALALVVSLLAWRVWLVLPAQGLALAGGALGVALILLFDRDCSFYAGLSGALHGLWAGNAVLLLCAASRAPDLTPPPAAAESSQLWSRSVALGVLLALSAKLLWQGSDAAGGFSAWLQIPVYRPAHWAGAVGGLLAAVLALALAPPAPRAAPARSQRDPR
ncbi:MAG: hypothetical protein LH479_01970 [Polaromonas sp.]|nr:hypothetical protein [Polaromonas sp.]